MSFVGRRFLIPRDYVVRAHLDPPSLHLNARWPTFNAFIRNDEERRAKIDKTTGLLVISFDWNVAPVPIKEFHRRLHVMLGTAVALEPRLGLQWEGAGQDSNPYSPHEAGLRFDDTGSPDAFLFVATKLNICTQFVNTIGGTIMVEYSAIFVSNWNEIEIGIQNLVQSWVA